MSMLKCVTDTESLIFGDRKHAYLTIGTNYMCFLFVNPVMHFLVYNDRCDWMVYPCELFAPPDYEHAGGEA
jgi:hypothetical protein